MLPLITLLASLALLAGCRTVEPTVIPATQETAPIHKDELAQTLILFARAPGPQTMVDIPFTDQMSLGLGDQLLARRPAEELVEAHAWVIDAGPAGFRERSGPFSALDVLAQADEIAVTFGPHASCNTPGQPVPPPTEVADLRRVSIEPGPDAVAACMQWWSVDLYITPTGEITAVTLDFGAP